MKEEDIFIVLSSQNQTGIAFEINKKNIASEIHKIDLPFFSEIVDLDIMAPTLYAVFDNLKNIVKLNITSAFLAKNGKIEHQINFLKLNDGFTWINFSSEELNSNLIKKLDKTLSDLKRGRINKVIDNVNNFLESTQKSLTFGERENEFVADENFSNKKVTTKEWNMELLVSGFFMLFNYDEIILKDDSDKYYYFSRNMINLLQSIKDFFDTKKIEENEIIKIIEKEKNKNTKLLDIFLFEIARSFEKEYSQNILSEEEEFNFLMSLFKIQKLTGIKIPFINRNFSFIRRINNNFFKNNISLTITGVRIDLAERIDFVIETENIKNSRGTEIIKSLSKINKNISIQDIKNWLVISKDNMLIEEIDVDGKIRTDVREVKKYKKIFEIEKNDEIFSKKIIVPNIFIDVENINRLNFIINLKINSEENEKQLKKIDKNKIEDCLKTYDKNKRIENIILLLIKEYKYNKKDYDKYLKLLENVDEDKISLNNRAIFLAEQNFIKIINISSAGESLTIQKISPELLISDIVKFERYNQRISEKNYFEDRKNPLGEILFEIFEQKIKNVLVEKTAEINEFENLENYSTKILLDAICKRYMYTSKNYEAYIKIINICKKNLGSDIDEKYRKIFLYEDTFFRLNNKYYPISLSQITRLKELDENRTFRFFRENEINKLIYSWIIDYEYSEISYNDYKAITKLNLGAYNLGKEFYESDEDYFEASKLKSLVILKKISKGYYKLKSEKINKLFIESVKEIFKEKNGKNYYENFDGFEAIKLSEEEKELLKKVAESAKQIIYNNLLVKDLVFENDLDLTKKFVVNFYFLNKNFGLKMNVLDEDFNQKFEIIYNHFKKLIQNEPNSSKDKNEKIFTKVLNELKEDYKKYFENYLDSLLKSKDMESEKIIFFMKKMRSLFNKIISKSFGYESLSENFIIDLSDKINQFIREYKIIAIKSFLNGYIDLVEKQYHSYKQYFEKAYKYIENLNKIYSLINESENGLKKMQDFLNSRGSSFEALLPTEQLSATINSLIIGENITKFKVLDENDSVLGPLYKGLSAINYNKILNECFKSKSGARKKIENIEKNILGSIYFNNIVKKTIERLKI